jgi:hypothetical protein
MWAEIEPSGFSARITRERCVKPPILDLIRGGGGVSPCLILWRGTCPGRLHSDPDSVLNAQSQTVSQLTSSGTMPTSKSPQFSPSGSLKYLRTGSVRILRHILTTRTEPWDFVKLSALYLSVHIEFSLCLNFYLGHRLGGYMVGATAGFPVEIVEALAP